MRPELLDCEEWEFKAWISQNNHGDTRFINCSYTLETDVICKKVHSRKQTLKTNLLLIFLQTILQRLAYQESNRKYF